jgi:hypothetical protein
MNMLQPLPPLCPHCRAPLWGNVTILAGTYQYECGSLFGLTTQRTMQCLIRAMEQTQRLDAENRKHDWSKA